MAISWYAVCDIDRENCGRFGDPGTLVTPNPLIYKNVMVDVQPSDVPFGSLPAPPSGFFFIEITQQVFDDVRSGTTPKFWDGLSNLPRLQAQPGVSFQFGSYADPTDDQTTFTVDVPIPDDRYVVKIYTNALRSNHIATETITEDATPGNVTRYLTIYQSDGTTVATELDTLNTIYQMNNALWEFDFNNGEATFEVKTEPGGQSRIRSDNTLKHQGPAGEDECIFNIASTFLRVET